MKVFTKLEYTWNDECKQYVLDNSEFFDYNGPIESCCGASAAQSQIQDSQIAFMQQAQQQSAAVFGNASKVFNELQATFAPIIAAGPNQEGFSEQEKSNLNSQAITNVGQSYKNARAAVGNAQSAEGGGNTVLPSGANIGVDLGLASSAANQTANELGTITENDYATGRQNYQNAVAGAAGATNTYNAATGATNAANQSGSDAGTTANQIATQDNSWMQAVSGALGAVGGAATGAAITKWG